MSSSSYSQRSSAPFRCFRTRNWNFYLIHGIVCTNSVSHNQVQSQLEPAASRWFHSEIVSNQTTLSTAPCILAGVWYEIPKEGQRTYRLECCEHYNEDEVNNSNILSDKIIYIYKYIYIFLLDDCRIKTTWNQLSRISIHAIKYK